MNASSPTESVRWHLRHRDQIVHGPYSLDQLMNAAKAGHLAPDSQIRHPVSTGGQWVLANSIPGIAEFCPRLDSQSTDANTSPAPRVKVVPRRKRPRTSRHWISICLQAAVPTLIFLIPGVVLYRSPHLVDAMTSTQSEPSEPRPGARVQQRTQIDRPPPPSARVAPSRQRDAVDARRSASNESGAAVNGQRDPAKPFVKPSTLDDLLPAKPSPSADKSIRLQLELDSQRWIAPLDESHRGIQLAVAEISSCPTATRIVPESGELSFDRPTRVSFDDMSGLAIDLRLDEVGSDSKLAVVGDWVARFKGDTETPFSLARLKILQKSFAKKTSVATNSITILQAERQQKKTFINSKGVKRLADVNAAHNRIKWIDSQLPALQAQALHEQMIVQQFLAFANNVQQLHDDGELVIRRVGDEHPDP